MELFVLDKQFRSVAVVDYFESVIWTDRFSKAGDFEIYTPATKEVLDMLQIGYYLWYKDSEHMMVIERVETKNDIEAGNHLIVSGRSLEAVILSRRIIWETTIIQGNLQNGVKKLLDDAIISPKNNKRKIANFIFEESTDESITSISIESSQYTGDNLYDVITNLCDTNKIGFQISMNSENQFVFKLYKGKNRSYDQTTNPYVVFSPNFDNIVNSNYAVDDSNYKNYTLVAGEEKGNNRKTNTYGDEEAEGLERRELYTDARDIQSEVNGTEIPYAQYMEQLKQRGKEKLEECKLSKLFDGETEAYNMFVYGQDFFLGDIVQLENEYGMSSKSKITEIIRSHKTEGYSVYPTFEIEKEEENK